MEAKNKTIALEFVLMGFTVDLTISIVLFVLFFCIYLFSLVGNSLIIHIIIHHPQLHKPMYFFLCNLSFIDMWSSSSSLPRLLVDLLSTHKRISLGDCLAQVHLLLVGGTIECLLLVLMAYDRFVAICLPLQYHIIMKWSICCRMVIIAWILAFVFVIIPSIAMPVTLCYPNQINHFMCEALAVLNLSCNKSDSKYILIFSLSLIAVLFPFVLIMASYICILRSVLKIHSAERSKAFSTCTSHLCVVVLFFGSGLTTYLGSLSKHSSDHGKYISIFYVIVPPMLNPVIYSLNNREVKRSLSKSFKAAGPR